MDWRYVCRWECEQEQCHFVAVRYYLSNLLGDAREIAHAVRRHWVLDMDFREDESRSGSARPRRT